MVFYSKEESELSASIQAVTMQQQQSIHGEPSSRALAEESEFHPQRQVTQNTEFSSAKGIQEVSHPRSAGNESFDMLFAERLAIAYRIEHERYYESYPTTLSLILLAHLMFLYQWNKRKISREVMVSYKTIVQKRQYHRAVLAFLSHPPTVEPSPSNGTTFSDRTETNDITSPSFLQVALGNDEGVHSTLSERMIQLRRFLMYACQRTQPLLQPFTQGHLSGLPLLFYNSHLLWSCRALEPSFESSWCYARILLGLTAIGLLFELRVTHNLLRNIASITFSYQAAGTSSNRNLTQTQQILLHRGIGTLTVLISGVLILFHSTFPYIPLQVFPFIDSSIRWWNPFMSYLFCLSILTTLSWKLHPVTSVLFGTIAGCLWSSGLISFLGESYWGSSMCVMVVVICLLSIKVGSSASRQLDWLPCIDYVGWNRHGELRIEAPTDEYTATSRMMMTPIQEVPIPRDASFEGEDDDGGEGDEDAESHPLLPSIERTSIAPVVVRNVEDVLHGRVPIIDMDDEARETSALSVPFNSNVRSRRGAGTVPDASGREGRER